MKLTAIIILIGCLHLSAKSLGQTQRISVDFSNSSIKEVFNEIERISDYTVFYRSEDLTDLKKVNESFSNKPVSEILDDVLEGTNLSYVLKNRVIVVLPKDHSEILIQQGGNISGIITDTNGDPVPGATVMVKGTSVGTVSDATGAYTIKIPDHGEILIFSFVGMATQEINVRGKSVLNVTMQGETIGIEEVVAVGYGTIKKSDLTSAIAKVAGEELEARPVSRVDQALQGQLAGVQVQQSGGKPGKNANIRIRGIGSITAGIDPLYVIDGFPVDGETFANMNLANIESIEVLKDAASASIYGSRGSNGVIIVTTRRGRKGQELKLDLNVYSGISNIERKIPFMSSSDYVSFMADCADDAYVQSGGDLNVLPLDRPFTYRYDQNLVNHPESAPEYDHQGAILQTGVTQSYQLAASGSTKKIRYLFSGDYFDQSGIVKNTNYKRYSARTNIDADLSDFLTVGLNLAPTYVVTHDKDTEGKGGVVHSVLASVPILPPRLGYWGESEPFSDYNLSNDTPKALAVIEHLKDEQIRSQVLADIFAQVRLLPELSFKTSFGANYYNVRRDRFQNQIIMRTGQPQGEYWGYQALNWLNENILSFSKTFNEKHDLGAIIGFTAQKEEYKSAYIKGTGYANDYVPTLNAATAWTANTTMSEWSLISYLSRINYSFSSKYLLSASIRTDGSSRFGANTKWGWFPSLSGAWRVDQENFMQDYQFINRLKLRASWGKTGNNNIGDYSAIATMGNSAYLFGQNEIKTPGMYPNTISNPNLGWEKTASTDIGFDLGLFDNRISLAVDYYNNQTSDLLLAVPVAAITGFTSETQNYGKVENKGWEFEIATINIEGTLRWTTNLNLSFNKNKVLQLGPNNAPIISGDWWDNANITKVGYPIGSYYMYKQTGVYNTQEEVDATPHRAGSRPGDVIIEDFYRDNIIDANDRQIFGSNIPKYFYGITNQFNYRGIDLSIFINGLGGNQIFNSIGREFDRPQDPHKNHYRNWVNRWRSAEEPGDGMTPRATNKPTGASNEFTNRFLYDGDYIRLKNITLGYTFPKELIQKIKLSNLRIYIQGENLHTWDHFDVGYTPEVDVTNGKAIAAGRDYGTYPTSRTILFGLNVSF